MVAKDRLKSMARTKQGALLLLIIVLLISTIAATFAASFVYYPVTVVLRGVTPPIVLEAPSSDIVNVSLSPYGTQANASVNIARAANRYDLSLTRYAIYWSDFNSPHDASSISFGGNTSCRWGITNGYLYLNLELSTDSRIYGYCYAIFNNASNEAIDNATEVYIESRLSSLSLNIQGTPSWNSHMDPVAAYIENTIPLKAYGIGPQVLLLRLRYSIMLYLGSEASRLSSRLRLSLSDLQVSSRRSDGALQLWIDPSQPLLTAIDSTINPTNTGFLLYVYLARLLWGAVSANVTAYVDNVVVTRDAVPWLINVTGLLPGYAVKLFDSQGNLIANATADESGVAVLNLWEAGLTWFAIPNGVIAVYENSSSQNPLVSISPGFVVGGDVYRFRILPVDLPILIVNNTGSQVFHVKLVLTRYSVSGALHNATLYLATETGSSTGITVVGNSIISTETNFVEIPASSSALVRLYVDADPGFSASFTLLLVYTNGFVEVSYPVNVVVEG
ncbi:MAG: hypothetical protein DRO39_05830 [Thermoprotei archaeon]|nr:MAG: hypothetical protein DRO39_05830 [Thermoprotei archaeon]